MAEELDGLDIPIRAKTDDLDKGLEGALKKLKSFGDSVARIGTKLTEFGKTATAAFTRPLSSMATFARRLITLRSAVIAILALRVFKFFVTDPVQSAVALQKQADSLGITAQKLAAYRFAAQAAGSTSEDLDHAFDSINQHLFGALREIQRSEIIFKSLGLEIRKASGEAKSADEIFLELFDRVEAGTVTIEQLKKLGVQDLAVVLKKGRAEFQKLAKEGIELGAVPDATFLKLSNQFAAIGARFKAALSLVAQSISTVVIPQLLTLSNHFSEFVKKHSVDIRVFARFIGQELGRVFQAIGNTIGDSSKRIPTILKIVDAISKFVAETIVILLDFLVDKGTESFRALINILSSLIGPAADFILAVALAKLEEFGTDLTSRFIALGDFIAGLFLSVFHKVNAIIIRAMSDALLKVQLILLGLKSTTFGGAIPGLDDSIKALSDASSKLRTDAAEVEKHIKTSAQLFDEMGEKVRLEGLRSRDEAAKSIEAGRQEFAGRSKALIEENAKVFKENAKVIAENLSVVGKAVGGEIGNLIDSLGKAIELSKVPEGKPLAEIRKDVNAEISQAEKDALEAQKQKGQSHEKELTDLLKIRESLERQIENLKEQNALKAGDLDLAAEKLQVERLAKVVGEDQVDVLTILSQLEEKRTLLVQKRVQAFKEELETQNKQNQLLSARELFEGKSDRIRNLEKLFNEKTQGLNPFNFNDLAAIGVMKQELDKAKKIANTADFHDSFSEPLARAVGDGVSQGILQGKSALETLTGVAQNLANTFITKTINNMTDLAGRALTEVFGQVGGQVLGDLLGAVVGIAAAIFARRHGSSTQTFNDVKSQIESTQAVRGIVAGPQNIAIAAVGDSLQKALKGVESRLDISNLLLRRIEKKTGGGSTSEADFGFAGSTATT